MTTTILIYLAIGAAIAAVWASVNLPRATAQARTSAATAQAEVTPQAVTLAATIGILLTALAITITWPRHLHRAIRGGRQA